jgi:SH3 domain protein
VRSGAVLLLALAAVRAAAATAYVSDELVLNVFAETNNQGQRLATLHSGSSLETLSVEGDFTQVRLTDGITGWVKSSYLTNKEPAMVRVKQLQDELDRAHATTPGAAEAAARNEVMQLKRQLATKQDELDALRGSREKPASIAVVSAGAPVAATPRGLGLAVLGVLAALAAGFWLGYATLARRVRTKFGGIKVY